MGAPSPRHKLAESGRFHQGVTPNPSYPQYPATPSSLGMPKSYEPELIQYIGAVRMAEGLYTKVVTEHRVRTDAPFQLASLGAAIGSYGSTYMVCKAGERVYKLEPNKDYLAIAGVGHISSASETGLQCFLGVFELIPAEGTGMAIPVPMKSTAPPEHLCDS
ncbi:hypothetical protein E8F12_08660 [Pseudomonas sp. BN102]|nr:hypothetical protein [Pseudomonas sp. BN102]